MYKLLLANSPLLVLPIIALFLFLVTFTAIVIRTFARRSEAYAPEAALPLAQDDRPVGGTDVTKG